MSSFRKGDIVKFNSDFFNTHTDFIVRNTGVPYSVIEFIKTHYFDQPFEVIREFWDYDSVKIDIQVDNVAGVNINRWWWRSRWLDSFRMPTRNIYIDQKEVIKLI